MNDSSKRTYKILGTGLVVLGLAWQQVQATRLGYEVERARRAEQFLKGRLGAIEMQLETSLSPAQLAGQAKTLGMVQAGPESLRILGPAGRSAARTTFLSRIFPRSWLALLST